MSFQLTLLALTAILGYGMAIQCYKCNGFDNDGGCGDTFVASSSNVEIVNCTDDAVGCKKGEINLGPLGWGVERNCENYIADTRCDEVKWGTDLRGCYCQTDLCNRAPTLQIMSGFITSAAVLVLTKLLL